jgi:hypothetical protein
MRLAPRTLRSKLARSEASELLTNFSREVASEELHGNGIDAVKLPLFNNNNL